MARPTRVAYHQTVLDLLDLLPAECPDARRLVDAHEASHGPLPASVREWLLVPNVLPLGRNADWWRDPARTGSLWYEFSNNDQVRPVGDILDDFADADRFVTVLHENQAVCRWDVERVPRADDPPVWVVNSGDDAGTRLSPTYSRFIWDWFRWWHLLRNHPVHGFDFLQPSGDAHAAGVWLGSPAAPLHPAQLDALTDRADPEQVVLPNGTVRHTYRLSDGVIRATADAPGWPTPHAAWWAEADSSERLDRLLAVVRPFGVLGDDARRPMPDADTDPFGQP